MADTPVNIKVCEGVCVWAWNGTAWSAPANGCFLSGSGSAPPCACGSTPPAPTTGVTGSGADLEPGEVVIHIKLCNGDKHIAAAAAPKTVKILRDNTKIDGKLKHKP